MVHLKIVCFVGVLISTPLSFASTTENDRLIHAAVNKAVSERDHQISGFEKYGKVERIEILKGDSSAKIEAVAQTEFAILKVSVDAKTLKVQIGKELFLEKNLGLSVWLHARYGHPDSPDWGWYTPAVRRLYVSDFKASSDWIWLLANIGLSDNHPDYVIYGYQYSTGKKVAYYLRHEYPGTLTEVDSTGNLITENAGFRKQFSSGGNVCLQLL